MFRSMHDTCRFPSFTYKEGLLLAIPHVSLEQENITYIKCLAADKEIKLEI